MERVRRSAAADDGLGADEISPGRSFEKHGRDQVRIIRGGNDGLEQTDHLAAHRRIATAFVARHDLLHGREEQADENPLRFRRVVNETRTLAATEVRITLGATAGGFVDGDDGNLTRELELAHGNVERGGITVRTERDAEIRAGTGERNAAQVELIEDVRIQLHVISERTAIDINGLQRGVAHERIFRLRPDGRRIFRLRSDAGTQDGALEDIHRLVAVHRDDAVNGGEVEGLKRHLAFLFSLRVAAQLINDALVLDGPGGHGLELLRIHEAHRAITKHQVALRNAEGFGEHRRLSTGDAGLQHGVDGSSLLVALDQAEEAVALLNRQAHAPRIKRVIRRLGHVGPEDRRVQAAGALELVTSAGLRPADDDETSVALDGELRTRIVLEHGDGELAFRGSALVGRFAADGMDAGRQAGTGRRIAPHFTAVEDDGPRIGDDGAFIRARHDDHVLRATNDRGQPLPFDDANFKAADVAITTDVRRQAGDGVNANRQAGALGRIAANESAIGNDRRGIRHRDAVRAARNSHNDRIGRAEDRRRRHGADIDLEGTPYDSALVGGVTIHDVAAHRHGRSGRRKANRRRPCWIHDGRRINDDGAVRAGEQREVRRALDAGCLTGLHPDDEGAIGLVATAIFRTAGHSVQPAWEEAAGRRIADHRDGAAVISGQWRRVVHHRATAPGGIRTRLHRATGRALDHRRLRIAQHSHREPAGVAILTTVDHAAGDDGHAEREDRSRWRFAHHVELSASARNLRRRVLHADFWIAGPDRDVGRALDGERDSDDLRHRRGREETQQEERGQDKPTTPGSDWGIHSVDSFIRLVFLVL